MGVNGVEKEIMHASFIVRSAMVLSNNTFVNQLLAVVKIQHEYIGTLFS